MTLMHGQAAPVGVPTGGLICEDCEKPIEGSAWCDKCHDSAVNEQCADAVEEAVDTCNSGIAASARDWIVRRKLRFPAEVTREIEAAFELFIHDAEDGQC